MVQADKGCVLVSMIDFGKVQQKREYGHAQAAAGVEHTDPSGGRSLARQ